MSARGLPLLPLASLLIAQGCTTPPAAQVSRPTGLEPRDVACITRLLSPKGQYIELVHHIRESDRAVLGFLDAHPQLDGRLTFQELLFLHALAQTPHRQTLLQAVNAEGDPFDQADPVARIKITLIRDALSRADFRAEVAQVLREAVPDTTREHGGMIVLSESPGSPLRIIDVPSAADAGSGYALPVELFTAGCIAYWHCHIDNPKALPYEELDNRSEAQPSGTASGPLESVGGDRWLAWLRGIDGLVFAPAGGGTFSVFFFGSETEVDLGTYPAE